MTNATKAAEIRPRKVDFSFSDVPRHWLGGQPVATQLVNGLNLLFPAGEHFFLRSVRHYVDRLDDETVRSYVKGFFGQEARHARAHEQFFAALETQGYDIRTILRVYEAVAYGVIEPASPPALRLAVTAACEHFTALLADRVLRAGLLDEAHPSVRDLLLWHAAEEIEHKAVAYDVLQAINPSYLLRGAGLALAVACLGSFWAYATASLVAQDRRRGVRLLDRRGLRPLRRAGLGALARGALDYMRPSFHPRDNDNDELARRYLASALGAVGLTASEGPSA